MENTFTCSFCGDTHSIAERVTFDGQKMCHMCFDARTCVCEHCGNRIWSFNECGDESHVLCRDCEEEYYGHCADCGCLLPLEELYHLSHNDEDVYCEDCYNPHQDEPETGVENYCYKPKPIFYGSGYRFLGVELEVDGAGADDENANVIKRIGNCDDKYIYVKYDGSLKDGLEIVTHPMTLDYHEKVMPWQNVLRKVLQLGYTSHKAETCGLHVHVNRSSLGDTYEEQDDVIARILFLVENFWNELLKFSRRTQSQISQWASRYGRKDDPKDVLHSAKSRGNRYACVNLTPSQTIEFRMFRGTLKYNTLIATLQMVNRLCDAALYLSDDDIKKVTWSGFVSEIPKEEMPELIQYLKERRLYVNEPVEVSEEV